MLLQKRISKPPQHYLTPTLNFVRRHKKKPIKPKKRQSEEPRCSFQSIPSPMKFSYSGSVYRMYGDLILMEQEGRFITDLSLLNDFKKYSSVYVDLVGREKLITIIPENLEDSTNIQWEMLVKELEGSKDARLVEWGKAIESYSKNVESALNKQSKYKKPKISKQKAAKSEAKKAVEKQKAKILEGHACIQLKYRLGAEDLQLTEICFTEKFIALLGYPVYSFINIVLREGIPQLDTGSVGNSDYVKYMMQNFSNFGKKEYETIELPVRLMLKYGYTRVITYRIHFFIVQEDDVIGVDTIFEVIAKEEPLHDEVTPNRAIKEDFLEAAIGEDENAATFLKVYYNETKTQRYRCVSQVCKIREIPVPEEEE